MKLGIHQYYWRLEDYLNEKSPHKLNIVASRDGRLYEIRHSALGTISVPASENTLRKLNEVPTGFLFSLPKIPGELLEMIVSFFRFYCTTWQRNEAMLRILWHPTEHFYTLNCPVQTVSEATVHAELETIDPFIEVMQIHSHNSMPAFFSSTDNEDEQQFLLYGVVGNLAESIPELILRVGVNGQFFTLSPEQIFTPFSLSVERSFPSDWISQITIFKKEGIL